MQIRDWVVGVPLLIYVICTSLLVTLFSRFVQVRYFFEAFKRTFFARPVKKDEQKDNEITSLQAFLSTLSSNLGNGSLAGMATAIRAGGPGSAFWVLFFGLLLMSVRFAEVYLSSLYRMKLVNGESGLGGPMLYLRSVAGGKILSYCYAIFCILFGLTVGNAMQTNSIRLSLFNTWHVAPSVTAILLFIFMLYVVCGGSARIMKASDAIIPVKVGLFFVSSSILLIYHYQAIPAAILLIIQSAFQPLAFAGGVIGFTVQQALRFGMARSIMATESGLGTAAIFFGFTESKDPFHNGLMGMMSTFISTLVCFLVALCIIASGVWMYDMSSIELTIAAYTTVFGSLGGLIVTFLSITFGIGVAVSYAYIVRSAWLFLTGGRYDWGFVVIYCGSSFLGAVIHADLVWSIGDLVNAGMLAINLFGIMYLLPQMRTAMMQEKTSS